MKSVARAVHAMAATRSARLVRKETVERASTVESEMSPVSVTSGGTFLLVRAKPGAATNSICEIASDHVSVAIAAPPVDGKANAEIVKFVASVLGVKKYDVALVAGAASKTKTLKVEGLSRDEVLTRLQDAL
eukprot:Amastigsp_a852533_21.p1 type:complete len:132 gc:universal Amastigsp_a852533_21:91-486(+)